MGHVLKQTELKRGPCAQEVLGPAGQGCLSADPELTLTCPLLAVADEGTQEGFSFSLGWAWGQGLACSWRALWASPGQAQTASLCPAPMLSQKDEGEVMIAKKKSGCSVAPPLPVTLEG